MSSNVSLSPHNHKSHQGADVLTKTIPLVISTLTVLLGIVGNSLVIWVAGFKLKATVTNVWLVNLAVADLVFCFTRVLSLVKKVLSYWPFGVFLCKFNGFFKYANMFCSVFLLAVISLDRVLCIWRPFLAKRRRTLLVARALALAVWTAAFVLSSPYFVYRRITVETNNLSKCSVGVDDGDAAARTALYANRFLCGFLLPFLVILVCYVLAAVGIRRSRLPGKSRPLRILALLVSAFFLCWAPYHCVQMGKLVAEGSAPVKLLSPLASALGYFNSCINPLLYFCVGLQVKGRSGSSLMAVYRRALEDNLDRQLMRSNQRSLDDSTASRHSTATPTGRSLTPTTPTPM